MKLPAVTAVHTLFTGHRAEETLSGILISLLIYRDHGGAGRKPHLQIDRNRLGG